MLEIKPVRVDSSEPSNTEDIRNAEHDIQVSEALSRWRVLDELVIQMVS